MNQLEGNGIFRVSFEIMAKDEKQARAFVNKCRGVILNTIKITKQTTTKKPVKK